MITRASQNFQEEISTTEAAKKYKLTASYVARLARTQTIRARKFGRDWIIDEEALRLYTAQPHKPGPKQKTSQQQRS
jgi:excisionase family DNA binding protein